jgi:hypothetical protein
MDRKLGLLGDGIKKRDDLIASKTPLIKADDVPK